MTAPYKINSTFCFDMMHMNDKKDIAMIFKITQRTLINNSSDEAPSLLCILNIYHCVISRVVVPYPLGPSNSVVAVPERIGEECFAPYYI